MAQDVLTDLNEGPQHRHHGAHRCRQDDDDRAHPVLHGHQPQDRRDARWRRRRSTGWSRSRSAASRSRRPPSTCFWNKNQINIIDTPGHVDFTVEVERSLRVLDGAVAVFDGKEGVEPQSETVWRQADKYDVPRICFVNKMDKLGADFYFTVDTIIKRLGAKPLVIQLPDRRPRTTSSASSTWSRCARWSGAATPRVTSTMGAKYEIQEIPADLVEKADEYRQMLLETVAETDDAPAREALRRRGAHGRRDQGRDPQADRQLARSTRCSAARRSRTAACSRCSTRSSTTSRRRSTCRPSRRHDVRDEEKVIERHADCERAVHGSRVQDRDAPVLRSPHLHPRLLGSPRLRRPGHQLDQGQEGAHREDLPDARQQGEPGRLASPPVTSTRSSASRTRPRVTRSPTRTTRSCSSR